MSMFCSNDILRKGGAARVNRIGKAWFPIMMILIFSLAYLTVFGWYTADGTAIVRGVKDIRWGMDVSGGVSVTLLIANAKHRAASFAAPAKGVVFEPPYEESEVSVCRRLLTARKQLVRSHVVNPLKRVSPAILQAVPRPMSVSRKR